MKDPAHHMTKFMKKILKEKEEENVNSEEQKEFEKPKSKEQIRKQKKIAIRKEREAHVPEHDSVEERNNKYKHRWPVQKERSHKTFLK